MHQTFNFSQTKAVSLFLIKSSKYWIHLLLLDYFHLYLYISCLFFLTQDHAGWLTTFTYKHITLSKWQATWNVLRKQYYINAHTVSPTGKHWLKTPEHYPTKYAHSSYDPSLDSPPVPSGALGSIWDRTGDFADRADSFSPWLPEVGSSFGLLLVLRKAWYWFQKPAELLVAGMFKEVIDVEEGSWSMEERLLRACGRVLVTTPWCFMCPWEHRGLGLC